MGSPHLNGFNEDSGFIREELEMTWLAATRCGAEPRGRRPRPQPARSPSRRRLQPSGPLRAGALRRSCGRAPGWRLAGGRPTAFEVFVRLAVWVGSRSSLRLFVDSKEQEMTRRSSFKLLCKTKNGRGFDGPGGRRRRRWRWKGRIRRMRSCVVGVRNVSGVERK